MPETEGGTHFEPIPAPETNRPAAYSLDLWVCRDDDRGQYTAEFPQVDGTRSVHRKRRIAINIACGKLGQIRNNRGKPIALKLRPMPEIKPDNLVETRVIGVS